MSLRTVVVSDIHLGAVPLENERAFLAFLAEVPRWGDDLLINGDLFDFWFEYKRVVPRGQMGVLTRLRDLVDNGIKVRFVGGNHDAWGGSFLEDEIGVQVLDGPVVTDVGGRQTYLAHGDGLGGADWGYRVLKWATRSAVGRGFFRWIHPDLGIPLAINASRTKEAHALGPEAEGSRSDQLAAHAAEILAEKTDLDLVVFGHAHRPILNEVAPGRFYLNAGDWIHHNSFAIVTPDEIRLERFEP